MLNYVMPTDVHDRIIEAAYRSRRFTADESKIAASVARSAAWHGIKTHNGIKAIGLDDHLGSKVGGCVPAAKIEKLPTKYKAVQRWNSNKKLGQAVAVEAMNECMRMADEFGIGAVAVDNAFHYLWGGGYVIDAADKGYIAYTCCTGALAEVVPFGGKYPTLGTNPHSWGFPTREAIGFPICIDWATSTIAMGRVQQFVREGRTLPPGAAVDSEGRETTDATKVAALLPFGAHKGYGMALIDEILTAYIGSSIPTIRCRPTQGEANDKHTPAFYFQCMRPDAIGSGNYAMGRTQVQNVKAVLADVLGHGNEKCLLPGQLEANAAKVSQQHNGLLFTKAEIDAFAGIAKEANAAFDAGALKQVDVG